MYHTGNGPSHGLSRQAKTYLAWRPGRQLARWAFGQVGNWPGGQLARWAFGQVGIWFWWAFFGGHLDRGHFFRRAFSFGGHLYRGQFAVGFWTEGNFLVGNWNYIPIVL